MTLDQLADDARRIALQRCPDLPAVRGCRPCAWRAIARQATVRGELVPEAVEHLARAHHAIQRARAGV